MFTSTRNKPFPSYEFIIINASTLRKTQKILYIWPENSYENSFLLPKMSFKLCDDAQVLRGNLVLPEESFSKCPGKGKETTGKNRRLKSCGQPELWPLHRSSLLFEHTLNFFRFFFSSRHHSVLKWTESRWITGILYTVKILLSF